MKRGRLPNLLLPLQSQDYRSQGAMKPGARQIVIGGETFSLRCLPVSSVIGYAEFGDILDFLQNAVLFWEKRKPICRSCFYKLKNLENLMWADLRTNENKVSRFPALRLCLRVPDG